MTVVLMVAHANMGLYHDMKKRVVKIEEKIKMKTEIEANKNPTKGAATLRA